jgi:hypothetical protein
MHLFAVAIFAHGITAHRFYDSSSTDLSDGVNSQRQEVNTGYPIKIAFINVSVIITDFA